MPNQLSERAREDAHFRVLNMLAAEPELSQRELAQSLGISLGRANYCVKALVDRGLVSVERFKASRRKAGYLYILTPKGVATRGKLLRAFLERKVAEYEALAGEIEALERELGGEGRGER